MYVWVGFGLGGRGDSAQWREGVQQMLLCEVEASDTGVGLCMWVHLY
jgi:hypothetical protein